MMSGSAENFGLEDNSLSLIDVSFEDDCLYATSSPPRDFQFSDDLLDNGNALSLNVLDSQSVPTSVGEVDAWGHGPQPVESPELEEKKHNVKYNLRKSLAWDSAFFTNAGVLEPDELSSMIEPTDKRGVLPGIREELERSTDSLSTLASEGLTMDNLEGDLFGDVRASIQKSSRSSGLVNSTATVKSGIRKGSATASSKAKLPPKKLEEACSDMPKAKTASKKTDSIIPGARRTLKQASPSSQVQQSVGAKRESVSLSKPPKIVGRVSISTAAKKAPLNNNVAKLGKDKGTVYSENTKDLTAKKKIPTSKGPRNAVSMLSPSLCSSFASTKTESIASTSFESISSDSSSKSSLNSVRRKVDPRAGSVPSSLMAKATSKISSKSNNHSKIPRRPSSLKSVAKLSPNVSPTSSVSEWSTESFYLSPTTSSLKKESNSSRSSIDTASYRDHNEDDNSSQVSDSQSHSSDCSAVGIHGQSKMVSKEPNGLRADSAKPSGLRLPSPKIGFFDGAKSSSRNLNGNVQAQQGAPSGLPRQGIPSGLPRPGALVQGKQRKLQNADNETPVRSPKVAIQQQLLSSKSKSPLSNQELLSTTRSVLRNVKRSPSISPRVQSKASSPGSGVEKNPKPVKVTPINEKVAATECNNSTVNPAVEEDDVIGKPSLPENSLSSQKDKDSLEQGSNGLTNELGALDGHMETLKEPSTEIHFVLAENEEFSELQTGL